MSWKRRLVFYRRRLVSWRKVIRLPVQRVPGFAREGIAWGLTGRAWRRAMAAVVEATWLIAFWKMDLGPVDDADATTVALRASDASARKRSEMSLPLM